MSQSQYEAQEHTKMQAAETHMNLLENLGTNTSGEREYGEKNHHCTYSNNQNTQAGTN